MRLNSHGGRSIILDEMLLRRPLLRLCCWLLEASAAGSLGIECDKSFIA